MKTINPSDTRIQCNHSTHSIWFAHHSTQNGHCCWHKYSLSHFNSILVNPFFFFFSHWITINKGKQCIVWWYLWLLAVAFKNLIVLVSVLSVLKALYEVVFFSRCAHVCAGTKSKIFNLNLSQFVNSKGNFLIFFNAL